jgi:precorrin-6A/cobalt-precorrin-6A reductase
MILVLAGTGEGRLTARLLEEAGYEVLATAATGYGGRLLRESIKGKISSRPLDLDLMMEMIAMEKVSLLIDATHPFAVEASSNACQACRQQGIPYLRLERKSCSKELGGGVIWARDIKEAAEKAKKSTGVIFLTTGSTHLRKYVSLLGAKRLVVRVLPLPESLQTCLELGIAPQNIIAMQGPLGVELNRAMFRQYRAAVMVTKESGVAGGTKEKVEAARGLGIPAIVIARPGRKYEQTCSTPGEAVACARKILGPVV